MKSIPFVLVILSFVLIVPARRGRRTHGRRTKGFTRLERVHFSRKRAMKSGESFFSFNYDGKPSRDFLNSWWSASTASQTNAAMTKRGVIYLDPKTGLQIRCQAVEYHDFPTVEWTLYFKNTSDRPTPIISDLRGADLTLDHLLCRARVSSSCIHSTGKAARPDDYRPLETPLSPGVEKRITAAGGRPTNSDLSYFNVDTPGQGGMIVVVGWPGQWAATFARDRENHLHIRAGQELTHFKLLPGEEVRTLLLCCNFIAAIGFAARTFGGGGRW